MNAPDDGNGAEMTRATLERYQVWLYLPAILTGLALGAVRPEIAPVLESLLWPALALLLYVTFAQIRLAHLPAAFRDLRFVLAALVGNFALLPLLVWLIVSLVHADPAVRLGLLLVLLVPCTDWFLTFTHQGGGDLRRAIAITPALLVAQMLLLPFYLRLFMGPEFVTLISAQRMLVVFGIVIILPLIAAFATERWAGGNPTRIAAVKRLGWTPVPLLAAVLFMIAASQAEAVRGALPLLSPVLLACIAFLIGAVLCGLAISRVLNLPAGQARALVFTLTTRNSFVVLPFALALPAGWEMTPIVIVFQSLVELFAMLVLLWLVPRHLLPAR